MDNLIGEVIEDRYQLLELIASGGMASIYSAIDLRLDRRVAVKIMHPDLADDENFISRFIQEARAAATISHPNVVQIHDQGWNVGGTRAVFLVMELVEGYTLRELLDVRKTLSLRDCIKYLRPILSALQAAHDHGVVHRDIKPENILISQSGQIKVADFGLATESGAGTLLSTNSSVLLGSANYLAPEQIEYGVGDYRSDIYACGILFFEMLTGVKPFDDETPLQTAVNQVRMQIPQASQLRAEIPTLCDEIIFKATEKNPEDRYLSATSFISDLDLLASQLNGSPAQVPSETHLQRSSTVKGGSFDDENWRESNPSLSTPGNKVGRAKSFNAEFDEQGNEMTKPQKSKKRSHRVVRNRFIALIILVALMGAGYLLLSGKKSGVRIPVTLVGESFSQAKKDLAAVGFTNIQRINQINQSVPNGIVISVLPSQGNTALPQQLITVTVSSDTNSLSVPLLAGEDIPTASTTLTGMGLRFKVSNSPISSSQIHAGLVADTFPPAGSTISKNGVVVLIPSSGPAPDTSTTTPTTPNTPVAISNYVGKSSDQALNELNAAGMKVVSTYVTSSTIPAGTVISQSPDGSNPVATGSTINLTISQGNNLVTVPNVYSLTQSEAQKAMMAAGLNPVFVVKSTKADPRVTQVSPDSGSSVATGSTITITLS